MPDLAQGVGQDFSAGPYVPYTGRGFQLLRKLLAEQPLSGCALEFGVGCGVSLRLIAARMPVIGFDSFQGLPEDWREEFPAGSMAFDPPSPILNARVVAGWFANTLPGFEFDEPIGLVHIDCDLYSSTATVLRWVMPHLRPGCVIVFDDWFAHGYDESIAAANEQRAWREYMGGKQISWDVLGRSDQEWAIRLA